MSILLCANGQKHNGYVETPHLSTDATLFCRGRGAALGRRAPRCDRAAPDRRAFGRLSWRRDGGLRDAFLLTLPVLLFSGLVMLLALRTYASDVVAALASTEQGASGRDAACRGDQREKVARTQTHS